MNTRRGYLLISILLMVVGGILLFRTPFSASDYEIVPDSVEYGTMAWRLAHNGEADLCINGTRHPSRYAPWFSVILSPFVAVGDEPGRAIIPVWLLSIAGLGAACAAGWRVSGPWGAFLAGSAVLAIPSVRFFGRYVMTDVPCLTMILLAACIYLEIRRSGLSSRRLFLAGCVVAASIALRRTSVFLMIPFLIEALMSRQRSFSGLVTLCAPSAVVVGMGLIHNQLVFGSPFRDGYNYWCPVPFDVGQPFSTAYFKTDLISMFCTPTLVLGGGLLLAVVLLFALPGRRDRLRQAIAARHLGRFSILFVVPLTTLYLFFFGDDIRYSLPLQGLLALNAGAVAGLLFNRIDARVIPMLQIILVAGSLLFRIRTDELIPYRRLAVEAIVEYTPADAVVITAIDPVYFGMFPKTAGRTFLPLHRGVEYASKYVAPRKIVDPHPGPVSPYDHRCAGLPGAGAIDPVSTTADEGIAGIDRLLQDKVPVYLDTGWVYQNDRPFIDLLSSNFALIRVSKSVYRVERKLSSP